MPGQITVPNTFASAVGTEPMAALDQNFTSTLAGINQPNTVVTTGTYQLVAADFCAAVNNTSAAPITVKLPAAPADGDWYEVSDVGGNANTYNITVNGNGHNIVGAGTYVMKVNYQSATFKYVGTTATWMIL